MRDTSRRSPPSKSPSLTSGIRALYRSRSGHTPFANSEKLTTSCVRETKTYAPAPLAGEKGRGLGWHGAETGTGVSVGSQTSPTNRRKTKVIHSRVEPRNLH